MSNQQDDFEQEEVYKVEFFEVIMPLRMNSDRVFNEIKFVIRSWNGEDKHKIVFLKKRVKISEKENE